MVCGRRWTGATTALKGISGDGELGRGRCGGLGRCDKENGEGRGIEEEGICIFIVQACPDAIVLSSSAARRSRSAPELALIDSDIPDLRRLPQSLRLELPHPPPWSSSPTCSRSPSGHNLESIMLTESHST